MSYNNTLQVISFASKNNPVERSALCSLTGKTDRLIRREISQLRSEGYRICSTPDRSGYFLASSEEEYQTFRRQYTAYANTIYKTVRAMDKVIPGQETLEIPKPM